MLLSRSRNSVMIYLRYAYKQFASVCSGCLFGALSLLLFSNAYALQIGNDAPDFTANTTKGEINFHKWSEGKYVLLFSHPQDFTPVCATELAEVHKIHTVLDSLDALAIGLSVDSVTNHILWQQDILSIIGTTSDNLNYPIIGDENLEIAKAYGMLAEDEEARNDRTPQDNKTARTVFLIGKDKKIKMMMTYPMTSGRNFDEIIRVLKSIKISDEYFVGTPANWKPGSDVVVAPNMSTEDAENKYEGVRVINLPSSEFDYKDYLRFAQDPNEIVEITL